jgi:hypothetical protein
MMSDYTKCVVSEIKKQNEISLVCRRGEKFVSTVTVGVLAGRVVLRLLMSQTLAGLNKRWRSFSPDHLETFYPEIR